MCGGRWALRHLKTAQVVARVRVRRALQARSLDELTGVEPTSTVTSPVDAPARLSSAQKRALMGPAFAAVITTALIAAPLLTPPSVLETDPWAGATLPAQSFAGPVAAVALADTHPAPRPRREVRPSTHAVSAALLPSRPIGTSGIVPAVADVSSRAARKPLSRRLTGWLTGDGTHTVRPFPSVPGRP
jgi:hypothetical protein